MLAGFKISAAVIVKQNNKIAILIWKLLTSWRNNFLPTSPIQNTQDPPGLHVYSWECGIKIFKLASVEHLN